MNPLIVYAVSACSGGTCQPVQAQQPAQQVVIVQQHPRPLLQLLQPKPQQIYVIQAAPACSNGKCK